MIISGITPPQVWAASSRSLTNIGSGAIAGFSAINVNIAANSTVDLRSSAGIFSQITVAVQTGAAATAATQIANFDGTAAFAVAVTAAAANSSIGFTTSGNSTVGIRLFNSDAAVVARYNAGGYLWTQ